MSHLLFKLNSVPDDEAIEVRQTLEDADILFYETDSGRFGLSFAGIWVKDTTQLEQAKQLIEEYQSQRYKKALEERKEMKDSGQQISRFEFFMNSPIKFSVLLIFASLLAYFTVIPFFK